MEANLKNKVEIIDGTNSDIITVLEKNFPAAARQTIEFAKRFDAPTIEQIAENVWDFLKQNVKYVSDGTNHQKIRLPARLIHDKEGDCKSFALFAASILSHYTDVGFRYSSYKNDPTPTHVYAIAKGENGETIIIDAVWHTFNDEKNFKHKKDHWMTISTLSGIEDATAQDIPQIKVDEYTYHALSQWNNVLNNAPKGSKDAAMAQQHIKELMSNIGLDKASIKKAAAMAGIGKHHWWQHLADKVHSALKGAWDGTKHLNPAFASMRNAYLALLDINYRGHASRIMEQLAKDPEPLKKMWKEKFGGNFGKLVNAAQRGAKHKALFGRPKGVNGPELIAAIIAAAAPILLALGKLIPKGKANAADTGNSGMDEATYQKLPGYDERADESSPYYDPTYAASHPNPSKSTDDVADVPQTTSKPLNIFQTILKDGQQVTKTIAQLINPQDATGATVPTSDIGTPKQEAGMGMLGIVLIGGIALTYFLGQKKRA